MCEETNNVVYGMDSVLYGINGFEDKTVREIINKTGNKDIWKLIKRGYSFSDEVLDACRITKTIRDEKYYCEFVSRKPVESTKKYKKDTASYEEIIESLSNVDMEDEETKPEETDDSEEFFSHDDE